MQLIEANGEDFVLHMEHTGKRSGNFSWSGKVAQIELYRDGFWLYLHKDSSETTEDLENARIWFEWSFCWRGVWEGRVYFVDDEFWSEELKTISILWDKIEKIVKERIISDNPTYISFDD